MHESLHLLVIIGLSPSPVTSATCTGDSSKMSDDGMLEERTPRYFRTTLTQFRKMQRQKRKEERMKKEQKLGRKVRKIVVREQGSSQNSMLEDEMKPKKRLSVRIREEEVAIKEMQQMLIELDHDETDVLKKMQELNNWRMKLESVTDNDLYMRKAGQLNDVILILEDRLHMLKNSGEKIEAKIGFKQENLAKLKVDYELMVASGTSEESIEAKELLKQFLPTLGLPSDTVVDLEDLEEDKNSTPSPDLNVPPRCRNPVPVQLLGETSRKAKGFEQKQNPLKVKGPLLDLEILEEYLNTLEQDLSLKRSVANGQIENDGMKKFMLSQIQNGSRIC